MQKEGLISDDLGVQFQRHAPRSEFVFHGLPNGIAEEEIPIVGLYVDRSIKRQSNISLVIGDFGMIDAIFERLIFCVLNINDKTKLDINDGGYSGGEFKDFWQFFGVGIPVGIDPKATHANRCFAFYHIISTACVFR